MKQKKRIRNSHADQITRRRFVVGSSLGVAGIAARPLLPERPDDGRPGSLLRQTNRGAEPDNEVGDLTAEEQDGIEAVDLPDADGHNVVGSDAVQQDVVWRDVVWHDVESWEIEGKAWADTERFFDRLPARSQSIVRPPVWDLSRHSAGMSVRFRTDASAIHVRYALLREQLAMPHMPATGVSGVDLYAIDADGSERWVGVSQPTEQSVETVLAYNLSPGIRTYVLYFPLYNGVDSIEVGVDQGAEIIALPRRLKKLVVFYGTSIMQGACASRPGMAIPAILGRRLNVPTVNLGFSGHGIMDLEIADLMSELDPAMFVLDCLPNMNPGLVGDNAQAFVKKLKAARPDTPVLLVEDRMYTNADFVQSRAEAHRANRAALAYVYQLLQDEGVAGIYYLTGDDLLGHDDEATVDGSHPSDLGMVRYADAYEPKLTDILS